MPPSASASSNAERERATAPRQSVMSCSGVSSAAVRHSQSGSASQSTVSHGGPDLSPEQPPAGVVVLDEGQVLEQPAQGDRRGGDPSPAARPRRVLRTSTPRTRARARGSPRSVAVSSPATGGSGWVTAAFPCRSHRERSHRARAHDGPCSRACAPDGSASHPVPDRCRDRRGDASPSAPAERSS